MEKMTVNMVVDEAVKAWTERVVNTPLHEEVMDAVRKLCEITDRHNTDYAMIMAINAAVSAQMAGALRSSAKEDDFHPTNLELLPEAAVELMRRALVKTCAN